MDKMALSRVIRFGLLDLSARNGHHGFEELCRALATSRIASNVYPATGPVSAGGDQGRDFQTFASHIAQELGAGGGFAALVSDGPIAFLCTLQAEGVPSKIRSDLAKIATGEPPVESVYAMLAADLPSAASAKLKREARERHGIALEVLDGQALAELLADHDTFWIAARWLAIPAEYAPEPPGGEEEPDWYRVARERWRGEGRTALTLGDVLELRDGMRHAVHTAGARGDLGFWLTLLRASAGSEAPDHVRQRARYELAFGTLRGGGDLRPADDEVRTFLDTVDAGTADWAELLDAGVLVQYACGALVRGLTGLGPDWVLGENRRLREEIEGRLQADDLTQTERAGLLDVLGTLRAHMDPHGFDLPEGPGAPQDILDEEREWAETEMPADLPLIDPDGAIEAWLEFARLAPEAPMVPIDSVARVAALLAPALIDRPGFRELTERLDEIQAQAAGGSAAAASSRDRAMALLRAERALEALEDLHAAKVGWWRGDTIRGSLLALLLIVRCYQELGLPMAARQHALLATGLAHFHGEGEHGDLLAAGLMRAADIDYSTGAWCAATETYGVAVLALAVHAKDPWNTECHEDLNAAYLHGSYVRAAAKSFDPDLHARIVASQEESGLGDVLSESEHVVPVWTAEEWRDRFATELDAVPFADAGATRRIGWSALGIEWEVTAANDYEHSRAAERFAAAAQVLCAELAPEELVLLPTTIRVRVQATDPERTRLRPRVRQEPDNEASKWIVDLIPMGGDGSGLDVDEVGAELTATLGQILFDVSLADWERYDEVLERCFRRGLAHKLTGGRPYDDLAGVVPRTVFEKMQRESIVVPEPWREMPLPRPAPALDATRKPGPGYTPELAEELVANRYRRTRKLLCRTLSRLAADEEFQQTYRELMAEGWKDWHLLLVLFNARLNERGGREGHGPTANSSAAVERANFDPEIASEPDLPRDWLGKESLREMRRLAFAAGLENWGLELHQQTPDFAAVERLLGDRYGYVSDDVDHEPLFATGGE
jgi:hypothetical protein